MFCIFAFVVFLILGIFSARYRGLAKKSWKCVGTKLTFRTCDISLKEEIRSQFIGSFIVKYPRFARFMDRWAETIAFIFVALSIWSLLVVINSGINYYVYDTCSPSDPESCTLSSGACGIGAYKPGFIDSLMAGEVIDWAKTETVDYFAKFKLIPDRMKTWKAEEYVAKTASYYYKYDAKKPTALEMIDPGCIYCGKMFVATKNVDFAKKYNFTYLIYPIPKNDARTEFKFKNSYLFARYVEASKKFSKDDGSIPLDWKLLERIYTGKDEKGNEYQKLFNEKYSSDEAEQKIKDFIIESGYSINTVSQISEYAKSDEVKASIEDQANIVKNRVRTVKIPTIIFNERRYDRVVDEKTLLK